MRMERTNPTSNTFFMDTNKQKRQRPKENNEIGFMKPALCSSFFAPHRVCVCPFASKL